MVVNNTTINTSILSDLFGSKLRAKVVAWIFTHPDEHYFVRQLTAILKEDATNVSRELARLARMSIVTCEQVGRQKHYRANRQCAIFNELHSLALKTAGLADILRSELSQFGEQLVLAFIYGSMASGNDTASSDIDLMIVGSMDELKLHRAISNAETRLARQINYTLMSPAEFKRHKQDRDSFITDILAKPEILVTGSADELR